MYDVYRVKSYFVTIEGNGRALMQIKLIEMYKNENYS